MNGFSSSVVFVTEHYDLHCRVVPRSGRLLNAFNDSSTRFLELEDVKIFDHSGGDLITELPKTVLVKDNIHLAILLSEDRSSESKVFFATLERKTMKAVISLPTVLVSGQVHVKSASDPQGFLAIEAGAFFPVTAATLLSRRSENPPTQGSVVMIRKSAITSLALERL